MILSMEIIALEMENFTPWFHLVITLAVFIPVTHALESSLTILWYTFLCEVLILAILSATF